MNLYTLFLRPRGTLIVLVSNCPGGDFGDPGVGFGGTGDLFFNTGSRSGLPLLLPVLKPSQDHQNHHQDNEKRGQSESSLL